MKNKIIFVLVVFILLSVLPIKTSAFWWFGQKKSVATTTIITTLSDQDKINLSNKYKNWETAFEKKNIDTVIANKDKFYFTVTEINYLFDTVSKTVKNPTLTNVSVTSSNSNINVSANFHKFISGHFSFVANIVSVENKIRLKLSYVKLYGISIPTKWLEEPINKELDKYFSFLYQDKRYQGFTFVITDNLLQLKPNF
jgi:hypothetical protein